MNRIFPVCFFIFFWIYRLSSYRVVIMLVIRHSYRDKNEDTCLWPVLCTILKMQATILSPRAEIRIASIFFVFCTFVFFFFFNLFFLLLYLFVCFYSLFTQGIYRIECYTLLKHYNKFFLFFFSNDYTKIVRSYL